MRPADGSGTRARPSDATSKPASGPHNWAGTDHAGAPSQSARSRSGGPPSSLRKWILVADDEKALRLLLVRVLTDAGYAVVAARNGVEALALAKQVFPHLIILDLRMPRMSGIEVLAQVSQTPVIVLSGYLRDVPPSLAARSNIVAMLQKPVTPEELRVAVRAALSHGEPPADAPLRPGSRQGGLYTPAGGPASHSMPGRTDE